MHEMKSPKMFSVFKFSDKVEEEVMRYREGQDQDKGIFALI